MNRWKSVVTDLGLNLLSNVTDSRAINIVAVKCGTGKATESELADQKDITEYKCDLQITSSSQTNETNYQITARLTNDNVSESFNLTQVGVYATLGDSQTQVIFMLMQCTDDGDVIPAGTLSKGFTATYQINIAFSNTENVNVAVTPIVEGLADVATSGSYNDLKDTPKISTVAVSGNYNDLEDKPSYNDLDYRPFRVSSTATELNAALSALGDSGGIVFLMPGTYDFTGANLSIGKNNAMIIGSGAGTVIKLGGSTNINILGNNVTLKNITIIREDTSSKELVLLDSDGSHTAKGFELEGVCVDCPNASNGIIRVTSNAATATRFISCTLSSDAGKFILNQGTISGIVNNCIASDNMTVPGTIVIGTNFQITAEV